MDHFPYDKESGLTQESLANLVFAKQHLLLRLSNNESAFLLAGTETSYWREKNACLKGKIDELIHLVRNFEYPVYCTKTSSAQG